MPRFAILSHLIQINELIFFFLGFHLKIFFYFIFDKSSRAIDFPQESIQPF